MIVAKYPAGEPGVIDLGQENYIRWNEDGRTFLWHHPTCRAWACVSLMPHPDSTGHRLVSGGQDDTANLTIAGSLLCPGGCGAHGYIQGGRWMVA